MKYMLFVLFPIIAFAQVYPYEVEDYEEEPLHGTDYLYHPALPPDMRPGYHEQILNALSPQKATEDGINNKNEYWSLDNRTGNYINHTTGEVKFAPRTYIHVPTR